MTTLQEQVILLRLKLGQFTLSRHARQRMQERLVTHEDLFALGRTGHCSVTEGGRWTIIGQDLSGDSLTAIVAWKAGVFVVTLY